MTIFDWILIAILCCSAILAFMRGLIRELFALCGLIAGLVIAGWKYQVVSSMLDRFLPTKPVANLLAFLLIAFGIMVLAALTGRLLHATTHAVGLGFFNRLAGAAFGLVRGGLIGSGILMAWSAFLPNSPWLKKSILTPYFLEGGHAVSFVVPSDLRQLIREGALQIKHNTADWIKQHDSGHNEESSHTR